MHIIQYIKGKDRFRQMFLPKKRHFVKREKKIVSSMYHCQDSYRIGEQMTVDGGLMVSDVTLPAGNVRLTYRLTDIYNQAYWTESIDR